MTREREKKIESLFRNYKANKKALRDDYDFPSVSGVDYSRIVIQTDKSRNVQEDRIVKYADRKANLINQVFIVDAVLRWYELEQHNRERFIHVLLINGSSWQKAEMECGLSRNTLCLWRREVLERAEYIATRWVNYFGE